METTARLVVALLLGTHLIVVPVVGCVALVRGAMAHCDRAAVPASAVNPTPQPSRCDRDREVTVSMAGEALTVVDVDREGLALLFETAPEQLRSIRALPFLRHDRPVGVKVYGIRPGSVLHAAGLRGGDVVHSVNGVSVLSGSLLEALLPWPPSVIDVSLTKSGRPARVLVVVHDGSRPAGAEAVRAFAAGP